MQSRRTESNVFLPSPLKQCWALDTSRTWHPEGFDSKCWHGESPALPAEPGLGPGAGSAMVLGDIPVLALRDNGSWPFDLVAHTLHKSEF
jgi:hypothetical protein